MLFIRSLLFVFFAAAVVSLSGCGGTTETETSQDTTEPATTDGAEPALDLSHLSAEDQALAKQQKFCPVGGKDALLGSGGMKAVKVNVDGRDVFLCCDGCEDALRADPAKYFAILDGTEPSAEADTTKPAAESVDPS